MPIRKGAVAGMPVSCCVRGNFRFSLRNDLKEPRSLFLPGRFMGYSRIFLKVCEGCGGLWFRAQDVATVYCFSCEKKLRGFSRPAKRRPGRPRKRCLHVVKGGGQ